MNKFEQNNKAVTKSFLMAFERPYHPYSLHYPILFPFLSFQPFIYKYNTTLPLLTP